MEGESKIVWIIVGAVAAWALISWYRGRLVGDPMVEQDMNGNLVDLPQPPEGYANEPAQQLHGDWRNSEDPGVALCHQLYGYCGAPRADQVYGTQAARRMYS